MSSKTTTLSDWLIDAKQLGPGDQLNIYLWDHQGPPPAFADMRVALHAQYGADTPIRIWKHGARICVFIHSNAVDRERFDERNRPYVIKDKSGRTEYKSGFERELPATVTAIRARGASGGEAGT